jgi:hypothetical protein
MLERCDWSSKSDSVNRWNNINYDDEDHHDGAPLTRDSCLLRFSGARSFISPLVYVGV